MESNINSKLENLQDKTTIDDADSDSADSGSLKINLDIPEETKKCILIKSMFDNKKPATIFFQYNYQATGLEKEIKNNRRIYNFLENQNLTTDVLSIWINKRYI